MTNTTLTEADVLLLTGLTATATIRGVDLKWDDATPGDDYDSASVYRSDTDVLSNSVKIGTAKQATQYMDNTVNANQTYYYWIRAVDDFNAENGAYEPAGPTGVSVTTSQADSPDIKNNAVSDYRSESTEAPTNYNKLGNDTSQIGLQTLLYTPPTGIDSEDYFIDFIISAFVHTPTIYGLGGGADHGAIFDLNFHAEVTVDDLGGPTTISTIATTIYSSTYSSISLWRDWGPYGRDKTGFVFWRTIADTAGELFPGDEYTLQTWFSVSTFFQSPPEDIGISFNVQNRVISINPIRK